MNQFTSMHTLAQQPTERDNVTNDGCVDDDGDGGDLSRNLPLWQKRILAVMRQLYNCKACTHKSNRNQFSTAAHNKHKRKNSKSERIFVGRIESNAACLSIIIDFRTRGVGLELANTQTIIRATPHLGAGQNQDLRWWFK